MVNFKIEEKGLSPRYRNTMREAVSFASDRVRGGSPLVRITPVVMERVSDAGVRRFREVAG